ncbi:hypothetical protein [Methylocystis hirsuta]|uniref:Uncharacterized protein n=1 Tax=Methylocystis hirsuta TaxID=369798 RepID=A0A3M9XQK3_9HYPH|nr:hypothetical protein [Methylocystis hirsuta]RNJ49388.1 hypothetical protein D1O30_07010 [Methylocystis hirsuta]
MIFSENPIAGALRQYLAAPKAPITTAEPLWHGAGPWHDFFHHPTPGDVWGLVAICASAALIWWVLDDLRRKARDPAERKKWLK